MKYAIVIEKASNNYSAYVPDLPGCIATGGTRDEVIENIREAIQAHIELMQEMGLEVPASGSEGHTVETLVSS